MNTTTKVFLYAALLILAPLQSHARYISLEVTPAPCYHDGQHVMDINIRNIGEEAAFELYADVDIGTNSFRGEILDRLQAGNAWNTSVALTAPPKPGIYPAIIRVHYLDARGYSRSRLETTDLITTPNIEEQLVGLQAELSCDPIRYSGRAFLNVTAPKDKSFEGQARIILPNELSSCGESRQIYLEPGQTMTLPFNITNKWSRAGSIHRICAVIEYDYKGERRDLTAPTHVRILSAWRLPRFNPLWWLVVIAPLAGLCAFLQFRRESKEPRIAPWLRKYTPALILLFLLCVTLYYIRPGPLLMNTTATGGDTPAHNYLASHLKSQLFDKGRIVSWGGGWWCGFPMFQFYFTMPYMMMALLSFLIPFNIAFKLVSVLSIFVLPVCMYCFGRLSGLKKPMPVMLSIASLPFLFDQSHTMWGLNINSTLAGMISAGLSLPFMVLSIGSVLRDTDKGRFRFLTVFLLAGTIACHFFTALLTALLMMFIPFLKPKAGIRRALIIVVLEGGLAAMLMSWWLIPLILKSQYSMDFGINWYVIPFQKLDYFPYFTFICLSPFSLVLSPFALVAIAVGLLKRDRFVMTNIILLSASFLLFLFGFHLSPVFVNIRLWPYFYFALVVLEAYGIGLLVSKLKAQEIALAVLTLSATAFCLERPHTARQWADWNYTGMEKKSGWPAFKKLVIERLDGTSGRLANDLHPNNHGALGSSRAFEVVPHLINKPIIEGGIVNSALGSMFSYLVQGETSDNSAGYPRLVKNHSWFNPELAAKHLALFNVKHFVARSHRTRAAFDKSEAFRLIDSEAEWSLYEVTTHDGRYVTIPRYQPVPVMTMPTPAARGEEAKEAGYGWKMACLQWMYRPSALDYPFAILKEGEDFRPAPGTELTQEDYYSALARIQGAQGGPIDISLPVNSATSAISWEEVNDNRISFRTSAVGAPHIIKCAYYPNWKAIKGADRIYMVTPCFMLVYPTGTEVELVYSRTRSDKLALALSWLSLAGICISICHARSRTRRASA